MYSAACSMEGGETDDEEERLGKPKANTGRGSVRRERTKASATLPSGEDLQKGMKQRHVGGG